MNNFEKGVTVIAKDENLRLPSKRTPKSSVNNENSPDGGGAAGDGTPTYNTFPGKLRSKVKKLDRNSPLPHSGRKLDLEQAGNCTQF